MKKIISMILLLTCLTVYYPVVLADGVHEFSIHSKADILETKEKLKNNDAKTTAAFEQFINRVDNWCMERTCHAQASYYIVGYYDDAEGHMNASNNLTHDAYSAYATALAWQLTGEDRYAEKTRELLNGWSSINTSFSKQDDTTLVGAYGGVGLIYGAELISEYSGFPSIEQEAFKTWVRNLYKPAIDSIVNRANNWGAWAILACMATNNYLGDTAGVINMANRVLSLINSQISPDGQMLLEIERGTNGMWYTYFCLAPLTQAAQMAYNLTGQNYFMYKAPSGASLKKALDFFSIYTKNPDKWDEAFKVKYYPIGNLNRPRLSDGSLDEPNWPVNLYEAMSDIYGSAGDEYNTLVSDYTPVMGGWNGRKAHHLAWSFPSLMKSKCIYIEAEQRELPDCIEDNFESGFLSDNWTVNLFPLDGNMAGISASYTSDPSASNNHVMKLYDIMKGTWNASTATGSGCVEVYADTQPITGLCEVDFDIKFSGTLSGSVSAGVHIQDMEKSAALVSLMLNSNGKLFIRSPEVLGGTTTDYVISDSIVLNKWYKIKVIINTDSKTFDIYIDNTLKASKKYFRSSNAENMSRIKFTTDSAGNNTVNYIDNVYVGDLRYDILNASVAGNAINATVVNGKESNAIIYAAAYGENNKIISIKTLETVTSNAGDVTNASCIFLDNIINATQIKLFIFEKYSIKPFCESYLIE